jgi:CDP-glucose 4,6-dehydratase
MTVEPEFWHGRTVLVTGHSGFKGSWLSLWLQTMGAEVAGYSAGGTGGQAPSAGRALFEQARVGEGMRSFDGDVADAAAVGAAIAEVRPEVVIHMAAQPLVRRSYQDPAGTYRTNVLGTVGVLDAVRQNEGVRAVVNVTTDKVYENQELARGYVEEDALGGSDPYSSSKAASELVTAAYRQSFFSEQGPAVATARSGNVIGGGDWGEDRLVPDIVKAALEARAVRIRNPNSVRPWQHVLNPLSGYLVLAQQLHESRDFAAAWNFGPDEDDAKPVGWIVERLSELWGDELRWQEDEGPHPHETNYLRLDSRKALDLLRWHPVWDLERALKSIVSWHKAVRDGADPRAQMLEQIEQFQRDAG